MAVDYLKMQLKRKYPWLGHEVNMWSTAFKIMVKEKLVQTQVGQYGPSVSAGDRVMLRQLQHQYLFTYVDNKGATTFAIMCKKLYLQLLDQEIGNNDIYVVSKETMKTLVERSPAFTQEMDIPEAHYKKDRDKSRLPGEEEDGWVSFNCSLFDLLALYL